ncbi:MAG TPA: hypothetical protein PLU30_05035 [Verrucomicrobiae bacterium]|nr:hypothetical protein [Verrucomicrobiae bacterium]
MGNKAILVPVDGASNIKLEALDYDTLATAHSVVADSPKAERGGLKFNDTGAEFGWFDGAIRAMPAALRDAAVVAPVARGASGGLVGADNSLAEVPGEGLTLAYTQGYPARVDERFAEIAGSREGFFEETGSIRDFPGSLTLLKRFLFEEMERPEVLSRAAGFAHYGALMGGHFFGGDYLAAIRLAGNEHSYWMCHSGARDVRAKPGTPSRAAKKVASFGRLVPAEASVCYRALGQMPEAQARGLGLAGRPRVIAGGHDTCLSHIPVLSTFYQAFPEMAGKPVLQVEAGTWAMIAQVGGAARVPGDGFTRDIIIQGTVDGEPVTTGRYGSGADFTFLKKLAQEKGKGFQRTADPAAIGRFLSAADVFVVPNVDPSLHKTGPFPEARGRIIGEGAFFADAEVAFLATNVMTALAVAQQVDAIAQDASVPIVLTAGGSKDPCFAGLIATVTGRRTYAMFDKDGQAVSETTTLGAAICGKAACLGIHPYKVDTAPLGVRYRRVDALSADVARPLKAYREKWLARVREG